LPGELIIEASCFGRAKEGQSAQLLDSAELEQLFSRMENRNMLTTSFVFQDATSQRSSVLINQLAKISGSGQYGRLRTAVAYATHSGCRNLVSRLETSVAGWQDLEKLWLVSIDFGHTEASALEFLRALPHSEVRIPQATDLLKRRLMPQYCFHPKTFVFDSGSDHAGAPYAIFIGSGNLTLSGLHAGVEHGTALVWTHPLSESESATLQTVRSQYLWWDEAWENAEPLTPALLTQYRRIRPVRPVRPKEDDTYAVRPFASASPREVDADPGVDWAHARCFWIETQELYKNRGKNRAGNQIDLRRGTRVFFGFSPVTVPRNTVLGQITLQYENRPPRSRSVRFANNSMDKINMPIPGEDGPENYDNTVVHFERFDPKRFRVTLGNHDEVQSWKQKSAEQGMREELAGGREFGFYN